MVTGVDSERVVRRSQYGVVMGSGTCVVRGSHYGVVMGSVICLVRGDSVIWLRVWIVNVW